MVYNAFGRISEKVSRFGVGCMRFPHTIDSQGNDAIDEGCVTKMIRYAISKGVNYFDTAYAYPGSEEVLGKALKGGYREKVIVATKCPMHETGHCSDYIRVLNESLRRLGTDYIDIYLFHSLDRTGWEKVKSTNGIAMLEEMKKTGKIRAIGFSFHADHDLFREIIDAFQWDMCLIQLNILDCDHQAGVRGLKYAGQKGIPVAIMEPLKGGILGGEPPEEVAKLLDSYHEKRSLVEWSFRWLYSQKEVKVVLSGVNAMDQLKDNIRIFSEADTDVLSPQDEELLKQIRSIYASRVRVGCTGCGYCMPCPNNVNIPEIFKVYNDSALSPWTEFGKTFYNLVAVSNDRDASKCTGCRLCETRCPQQIPVAARLREAHEAMKPSQD
jgi:predicted aldo/keto reductase-like oxidoreductase